MTTDIPGQRPAPLTTDAWTGWSDSWAIHLRARNVSKETSRIYLQALCGLADWARTQGIGDPAAVRTRHLEGYFAHFADRKSLRNGAPLSAAYLAKDFRSLKVFYKWLATEEELHSPMAGLASPIVPQKRVETFGDDELLRLLGTCKGRTFADRRDTAILRVLLDSGIRIGELTGLGVADVDLAAQTLLVNGKGRKSRLVPFGLRTTEALNSYLRTRAAHRDADLGALWLSIAPHYGSALGQDGIRQLLRRHAAEAGVEGRVYAHRFRHTSYDAFVDAGGDGGAAMAIYGWSSRAMLDHYAASNAERRALKQHKRLSPGDRV